MIKTDSFSGEDKKEKDKIINDAINDGIKSLIADHKQFTGWEKYLLGAVDIKKLKEFEEVLYNDVKNTKLKPAEVNQYVTDNLVDYISSGQAFNEDGQEIVLKKGLERKARKPIGGFFARGTLKRANKLDEGMEGFYALAKLFQDTNYSRKLPEIAKAVETVKDMGWLNKALGIMEKYKILNDRKYYFLTKKVYHAMKENKKYVVQGIENYVQKAAASIFGIFGLGIIMFNAGITGAVVGTSSRIFGNTAGIVLVILSSALFLSSSKKKF